MPQLVRKQRRVITAVTCLVFAIMLLLSVSLVLYLAEQRQHQKQRQVAATASSFAYALQQELSRELSAANALAAFVRLQDGEINQFDKFAQKLFPYYQ